MITTDPMTLRPLARADLDRLIVLDRDPTVKKYPTGGRPSTIEESLGRHGFDEPISGAEHGQGEYELQSAEWVRLPTWPQPK